jgi:hypothetical protein|tara:strand:+ start:187 stop:678 length:492 start_codon:yes stop_codon:yes gene_type:complete
LGQGETLPLNFVLENKMELAKTDYQKERELSNDLTDASLKAANERIERRDAEIARLREEMEAIRTVNGENAMLLDDIRLASWRLHKDQISAMVSGEIAEQLKTKETAFDIQDHMDEIREDVLYNLDITSFQSEIEEIVSERDIDDDVTEIVKDVLKKAKITLG